MSKLVEHHSLWSGLASDDNEAEIAILGIPFDNAVSWRGGTRHAPERIRSLTPHLAYSTEEGMMLSIRVIDASILPTSLRVGKSANKHITFSQTYILANSQTRTSAH